ncbi:MAG: hypothetical protein ACK5N0_09055 [Synechococcaceae cyanobacterium]
MNPPRRRPPEGGIPERPAIMQQWEYQVIHLNVDSSGPGRDTPPSPSAGAPTTLPPFTKTYLEQEFPAHYGPQQPPGSSTPSPIQQPHHPAVQLQGFINSHGRKGWELLGIFPLGSLLMMIFRRPLPPQADVPGPLSAADAAAPGAAAQEAPAGEVPAAPFLTTILERLDALERRLPPVPSAPPAPRKVRPSSRPGQPSTSGQGDRQAHAPWILGQERLNALLDHPPCSTAAAARSLGFRSAASLLNQASRHGYPIGLVWIGPNGKAAVYQGSAPNQRGGRDLRLWLVVERDRLPEAPA